MKVPFGTMSVTPLAKRLANKALDTKNLSCGKYVSEFEDAYAKMVGTKYAVAVASGTDADILALAVLHDFGMNRGDEVIIPALSFVATGNAVVHAGFTPVFVDVKLDTLNIDPSKIEAVITKKTKAIMPVHLMGKPAAMDKIIAIAKKHKLFVIEDAAEAHGTIYKGKNVGTWGDMAAYSLYAAHMISTVEGGIITTNNARYAEILRSLRSHGRSCNCETCVMNSGATTCAKRFVNGIDKRFIFERIGYSCKMNELEAAVGIGNLKEWPKYLKVRRRNLLYMLKHFTRMSPYLLTFKEEKNEVIGPHAFPIIVAKDAPFTRDQLVSYYALHGIDSRNLFQSMPTQCPGFAYLGYRLGDFPVTEYIADHGLHIGIHQDVSIKQLDYVLDVTESFLHNHKPAN